MVKKAITKVSTDLLDMLNKAVAIELQVSIQYMMQYNQWSGVKGFTIRNELKSIALEEMKQAEAIAERLTYLGGIPTTKPNPIFVGTTPREMVEQGIKDEENGIKLYKQIIEVAVKEGDETTNRLFRKILREEEEQHDTLTTLLEDM